MSTPSDTPPDGNPPNPVSQVMQQPSIDDCQEANGTAVKEISPTSVFVNSEPIREEQVQNAVKFLSHPKVRGSPVMYRRSFLERKGLTKEEIDEAFRRVPDPTPTVSPTQLAATNQAEQTNNVQPQPPTQVPQLISVGHVGSNSKMGMLSRLHWSHALLAVGFLAASGAGTAIFFKNAIIPRLKTWIRKVVSEEEEQSVLNKKDEKPSIAEEAAAAAKSAAAAAASVAQASLEMSMTKIEEKRLFEELINMLNTQGHEMKSMGTAIQKLESGQSMKSRIAMEEWDEQRVSTINSRELYANGKTDTDSHSAFTVKSLPPPVPVESAAAPHPKSYMDIMAMIQRGEKPSNIREINDAPPNPNQPFSNPNVAPRPKPWEVTQNTSNNNFPAQESNNSGLTYEFMDNQMKGNNTEPWWQRKNVRITEMESGGDEQITGSSNVVSNKRPVQRSSWVPPRPPPVVMPEAAAAIRQQKKQSYQNEQMTDDQLLARSSDIVTNELQRITKMSESSGAVEAITESSGVYANEIQKEENGSYYVGSG